MELFSIITIAICLVGLFIGSFTDIRRREIPDMINYGLLAIALGIRIIYSITSNSFSPLIEGALGFALAFIVACLMFYTGQWGGGDAKLLMALGGLIGLKLDMGSFLITFLVNSFIIGAFYGVIWGIALAVKHSKAFSKEFARIKKEYVGKAEIVLFSVTGLALAVFFIFPDFDFRILLVLFSIMPIMLVYLWVFAKSIEECCMIKAIDPEKLTEGDWLHKDIRYKGRIIASKKDLGLDKRQISKLIALKKRKALRKVIVKEGIPFTPSFLMAYIATLLLYHVFNIGSWMLVLFR